jgi:hypothetical protein
MMKTRNTTTKLIAMVIAVTIATTIWTIWGARPAQAVVVIGGKTGIVSIARGQALSAHVVNTGDENGFIIDGSKVLDSAGNTLAEFERTPLTPGHAATFEFMPRDLSEGQRLGVRVVLMFEGASRNKPDLITTYEVYDIDTGKTTFGFHPPGPLSRELAPPAVRG